MYAFVTPGGTPTQYLRATNLGFTIPGAAVINGIVVNVERKSAAGTIHDARVRIVKGGVVGATDKSNPHSATWPTTDAVASYVCLYAGTASALGGATIPPGSNWSALGSKGFKYKDPSGTADRIQKVLLKSNPQPNKSKILAKGKGVNLPDLPAMPFDSPVTVQLSNDSNSVCYESVFTNFKKNANGKFKAKLP